MIIKKNRQKLLGGEKVKEAHKEASDSYAENSTEDISIDTENTTPVPETAKEPEIDLFDIENIDFAQRQERRRGTRRRGYRRIDDRNLVSRAHEEAESIKQSAFEEGYRRGLEQASSDIAQFKENIKTFMGAPKEVFEYVAPDILEISVDIAKRILKS